MSSTSLNGVYRKAQRLLTALNQREVEAAYALRDEILFGPQLDLRTWIASDKARVGLILYALGQILSRNCLFRTGQNLHDCQFDRIDGLLEITHNHGQSLRPEIRDSSLETAARLTFYYGVSALHRRLYDLAHGHFDNVRRDGERLRDYDLQANAHFYLSTCDRKQPNRHDTAVEHLKASKACLEQLHAPRRIAVVEIHRAWEEFSLGRFDDTVAIAHSTERNSGTDFATKAHAQSLLARIERRRKNYTAATRLTSKAIENFEKRDPHHRALARAYANLAHTKILQAKVTKSRTQRKHLLATAEVALNRADKIYSHRHYDRQTRPEIENLRATIEHCRGDFSSALDRTSKVLEDARNRSDFVEMSTASVIQCMCLLDRDSLTGRLGAKNKAKLNDVIAAHGCAQQALASAEELGSRMHSRRQARAHIWLARVLVRAPFFDLKKAKEHLNSAHNLLPPPKDEAGYIGEELETLRKEVGVLEDAETSGEIRSSQEVIFQITANELLAGPWKDAKQAFEETLIAFLVNNGLRHSDICERLHIRKEDLTIILHRCVENGAVSQARLDARKGRHENKNAESSGDFRVRVSAANAFRVR